jgi:hypothetical protein
MIVRLLLTLCAALLATVCHTPRAQQTKSGPLADRPASIRRDLRHVSPPRPLSWRPATPRTVGLASPIA